RISRTRRPATRPRVRQRTIHEGRGERLPFTGENAGVYVEFTQGARCARFERPDRTRGLPPVSARYFGPQGLLTVVASVTTRRGMDIGIGGLPEGEQMPWGATRCDNRRKCFGWPLRAHCAQRPGPRPEKDKDGRNHQQQASATHSSRRVEEAVALCRACRSSTRPGSPSVPSAHGICLLHRKRTCFGGGEGRAGSVRGSLADRLGGFGGGACRPCRRSNSPPSEDGAGRWQGPAH